MLQPQLHTAILIFARSTAEELRYKSFGMPGGKAQDRQIIRLLNRTAQSVARRSGLPSYVVDSHLQKGKNFGERFTHAIQSVFDRGYERVIAIGNDCLSLRADQLRKTADLLSQHDLIVGPTEDEGIYLLGMTKAGFQRTSFTALPWQTANLRAAILQLAEQKAIPLYWLATAIDADDLRSLRQSLRFILNRHFYKTLLFFLFFIKRSFFFLKENITPFPRGILSLRAPPKYLAQ